MPWDLRPPVDNYFISQGPPGPPGRQVRVDLGLVLCHLPLLPQLAPHCVPSFLLLAPTSPHCQLVSSLIPQPLRTPSALTSPLPLVEPFISLVISPTGGHGTWSQREGIRVCGWSEAVSTGRHPLSAWQALPRACLSPECCFLNKLVFATGRAWGPWTGGSSGTQG